jgi:hypothetical protein
MKNRHKDAPGQHMGNLDGPLDPTMKDYRCQNVYITATASERIVDTLEFPPHNSPMSQMSPTDRILMTAQDMTDALKHPHPKVPFATIGDDTISDLATSAELFTRKFKKRKPLTVHLHCRKLQLTNDKTLNHSQK